MKPRGDWGESEFTPLRPQDHVGIENGPERRALQIADHVTLKISQCPKNMSFMSISVQMKKIT